jgi:hypothetical protein
LNFSRPSKTTAAAAIARVRFVQRIDHSSAKSFAIYDGWRIDVDNNVADFISRSDASDVEITWDGSTAWNDALGN